MNAAGAGNAHDRRACLCALFQPSRKSRDVVSHAACERQCGRCSACIHADAWQRRGGRPYLGTGTAS